MMRTRFFLRSFRFNMLRLIMLTAAVSLACSFSGTAGQSTQASVMVTLSETPSVTPVSTLTASPQPTITPLPSLTPVPTQPPVPTTTPTQVLPGVRFPETPVPVLRDKPFPDGQMRILLIGVDNSNPSLPRADSIVMVSLNTRHDTASMLSIPPALYVNIPDVGMERINSSLAFGGPGKLLDTIQYNLGIRADRFLAVDFTNFTRILDYIGPIDVHAGAQLRSQCGLPNAAGGWCVVEPGFVRMDKDIALWYVRDAAGGEMERMRRGQEVLAAIFTRLMDTQAPARIDELMAAFQDKVDTDITRQDLIDLTPVSVAVYSNGLIKRAYMSNTEAVPFNLPGGQNVLLLDQEAAWNLISRVIFTP